MFGLGAFEILIILLAVLILFGPERLPDFARKVGRITREARTTIEEFKRALYREQVKWDTVERSGGFKEMKKITEAKKDLNDRKPDESETN